MATKDFKIFLTKALSNGIGLKDETHFPKRSVRKPLCDWSFKIYFTVGATAVTFGKYASPTNTTVVTYYPHFGRLDIDDIKTGYSVSNEVSKAIKKLIALAPLLSNVQYVYVRLPNVELTPVPLAGMSSSWIHKNDIPATILKMQNMARAYN